MSEQLNTTPPCITEKDHYRRYCLLRGKRKRGRKRLGPLTWIDIHLVVRVVLLEVGYEGACVSIEAFEELARQIKQCLWN